MFDNFTLELDDIQQNQLQENQNCPSQHEENQNSIFIDRKTNSKNYQVKKTQSSQNGQKNDQSKTNKRTLLKSRDQQFKNNLNDSSNSRDSLQLISEDKRKIPTKNQKDQIIKTESKKTDKQNDHYIVEKIEDKRFNGKRAEYLIKWVGWSIKSNTWEPLKNLMNVKNMVDDFENQLKKQQKSQQPTKQNQQNLSNKQQQAEKNVKTQEDLSVKGRNKSKEPQNTKFQNDKKQSKQSDQLNVNQPKKDQDTVTERLRSNKQSTQIEQEKLQLSSSEIKPTRSRSKQQPNVQKDENQEKNKKITSLGSFELGDKLLEIKSISINNETDDLDFKVKWQKRPNGVTPQISIVTLKDLNQQNPKELFQFMEKTVKENLKK